MEQVNLLGGFLFCNDWSVFESRVEVSQERRLRWCWKHKAQCFSSRDCHLSTHTTWGLAWKRGSFSFPYWMRVSECAPVCERGLFNRSGSWCWEAPLLHSIDGERLRDRGYDEDWRETNNREGLEYSRKDGEEFSGWVLEEIPDWIKLSGCLLVNLDVAISPGCVAGSGTEGGRRWQICVPERMLTVLSHSIRRRGKQNRVALSSAWGEGFREETVPIRRFWINGRLFYTGGRLFNFEMGGGAERLVLLWNGSWSCGCWGPGGALWAVTRVGSR